MKRLKGEYPNVRSMLIIKDDKLVFEEYFYDYNREKLQEMRSASKSVISALTGIAIQQKLITGVNVKLSDLLPQYNFANPSPLKYRITLKDMLDNQSGVAYDIADPKLAGNETAMNYSSDWVKYTYDLPMVDTSGIIGRYNSGNPITVARIIELRSGMSLHDYAAKYLFDPMGIKGFKWNFKPDQSNAENFGQVYVTPRDMAKFGLLYLNEGKWRQKIIVPENWVRESTSKHSVVQNVDYGYFWWLKYLDTKNKRYQSIAAQGNGGQKIYIFKELKMVVVTTGGNYNSKSPSDELIRDYILPSFD
ncbi:MAG: serine hydrolase [Mucilaginibacter sp.]|nr:serine hydrolase [Mucilaginibacter sp.]